ncbi:hypothetical protein AB0E04_27125 [Streptomyces sp. NPDC048251]|uniref:hypothetical protein n=1 Tax=Streptomyces sp. NPDC048251 TaxID=3154501 RepID=UPI00344327B3
MGELRRTLDELRRRLPGAVPDDPDALATYGTLLAQARRLADQLVPDWAAETGTGTEAGW